ncbi:hypothetical protein FS837_003085 [Tulasnella sp. UAMH 9824]|nr:hypothetical protein FS837_003085 [Tulasnella sp. UAMH 9824]
MNTCATHPTTPRKHPPPNWSSAGATQAKSILIFSPIVTSTPSQNKIHNGEVPEDDKPARHSPITSFTVANILISAFGGAHTKVRVYGATHMPPPATKRLSYSLFDYTPAHPNSCIAVQVDTAITAGNSSSASSGLVLRFIPAPAHPIPTPPLTLYSVLETPAVSEDVPESVWGHSEH